jgi:hypothetical protein
MASHNLAKEEKIQNCAISRESYGENVLDAEAVIFGTWMYKKFCLICQLHQKAQSTYSANLTNKNYSGCSSFT